MSPWWATATLVWVCLQGAFGAWTVTWKLFPAIVTLHLAGALVLLALLCVLVVRGHPDWVARELPTPLRRGLVVVAGLLAVQILLGGWVSTNYAVLACSDFPVFYLSGSKRNMDFNTIAKEAGLYILIITIMGAVSGALN